MIGVTGADGGSVFSALGDNAATVVGVLKNNVHSSNRSEYAEILPAGASVASEGIVVNVPDWTFDTEITVMRR